MAIDYKDKIKKLLALAESQNQHEAKAALLKARQLMAEHKLREVDCVDSGKLVVRRELLRDVYCTKRKNSWIVPLSAVIAERYCCQAYRARNEGKQKNYVGFIGIEDDFTICVAVFRYALDCIMTECKKMQKQYKRYGYPAKYVRRICDAYGFGFCNALCDMFDRQDEENQQYGIVLTVPEEVTKETSGMKEATPFGQLKRAEIVEEVAAKAQGYSDGEKFDPEKRIEGEKEKMDDGEDDDNGEDQSDAAGSGEPVSDR